MNQPTQSQQFMPEGAGSEAKIRKTRSSLRSPLLGYSETEEKSITADEGTSASGLRSPLLGGASYPNNGHKSERTNFPHRNTSSNTSLQSNAHDPSNARPQTRLKSPLLGDDDKPEVYTEIAKAKDKIEKRAKGRLHSPVLDGGFHMEGQDPYQDAYDQEDIHDPNILRSPLLAAKVPLSEKAGKETHNQSAAPSDKKEPVQDITPLKVPALSQETLNPNISSLSAGPGVKQSALQPETDTRKAVMKTSMNESPLLNERTVFQPKIPRRTIEDATSLGYSQSSPTHRQDAENTLSKFATIALSVAIFCKLWYLLAFGAQAWASPPFLFDQFGQIIVIVCLIILVQKSHQSD